MEKKVLERLDELGITESMVIEHRDKGGRSAVIGTFRILMYRASCEETESSIVEQSMEESQDKKENFLALPAASLAGSLSRSIKSQRSDAAKLENSSSSSQRLESVGTPPSSIKEQPHQQSHESPGKNKLKYKLNFTILPNKKNAYLSEKRVAKKKKGSQTCIIL